MADFLRGAQVYWENEWRAKADPRSANWLFVGNATPMLCWLVFYLAFVAVVPRLMKSRKPFELRSFMALYNVVLVAISVYMMVEFQLTTWNLDNRYCTATDFSDDPMAVRLAGALWVAYISKAIEFFDTFIFILRKKDSQVTFLHVYHHAGILVLAYMSVNWYSGGITWFWQGMNAFIHTVMYSYYFLSGLGPHVQKYLWWKRYITQMQILQFVADLILIGYSFANGCDHPTEWRLTMGIYLFSLLVLFSMFYLSRYQKSKKPTEKTA